MEQFTMRYQNCPLFPRPGPDIWTEGSKTSGLVLIEPLALVQQLMDTVKWRDLFPCIIADERPHEGQPNAPIDQETIRASISMMRASFHVMTPIVRVRETTFCRTCVRLSNVEWIVFDIPMNHDEVGEQSPFVRGCLVRRTGDPRMSDVTWMELTQVKERDIPTAGYEGLLENGLGFGSLRWFETLARECRRPSIYADLHLQEKERQFPALAQRMTRIFSLGISQATPGSAGGRIGALPTNVSLGISCQPVEDDGAVNYATAVKSQWINVNYGTLFAYVASLRDPYLGDTISHLPNHDSVENYVGLYMYIGDHNMRFIREVTKDACGATVVTAPITKQRLAKNYQRRTRKNDLILNSEGYVLCPLGGGTLLTVARQLNVGNFHADMNQTFNAWTVNSVQEISNRINNIQLHFQPHG